jgi:hypothetical protein
VEQSVGQPLEFLRDPVGMVDAGALRHDLLRELVRRVQRQKTLRRGRRVGALSLRGERLNVAGQRGGVVGILSQSLLEILVGRDRIALKQIASSQDCGRYVRRPDSARAIR